MLSRTEVMHQIAASAMRMVKVPPKRTHKVHPNCAHLSVVRLMTSCHKRSPFWRAGTDHADMGSSDI
jgi:hypothetical protein